MALTFDDRPGAYTELALEILGREEVSATFFIAGVKLQRSRGCRGGRRRRPLSQTTRGRTRDLTGLPTPEIRAELARTTREIERLSGSEVLLFRPPYGARDTRVDRVALELGLLPVIWSVASGDSDGYSWREIGAAVERGLRPGAIVLMHENRGQTIRALRYLILPALAASGLRAVIVPELLALDPPTRDQLRRGLAGCG